MNAQMGSQFDTSSNGLIKLKKLCQYFTWTFLDNTSDTKFIFIKIIHKNKELYWKHFK